MDRYIIKVDDREMISIYYEEGCIFLKILINGEVKGERILIQGVRERYTVNLSPNGYIYLFCQNISGDIIHLKYKTGELSQNIILENKSKNCKDILFYCIENNSEMNLIYNKTNF